MNKRVVFSVLAITTMICVTVGGCVMPNEIQENRDVNVEVVA